MSPGCNNKECGTWGIAKLLDGKKTSTRSLAITSYGAKPFIQLDLGSLRTDIAGRAKGVSPIHG